MTEQTSTTPLVPVAWERRPDGGKFFTPGKAHLRDGSVDLDVAGSLRTVCGTDVPIEVLRALRGAVTRSTYAVVDILTGRDLDEAQPCRRCERAAEKMGAAR